MRDILMKKKQKIGMVVIEGDRIKAFDTEGVEVKLTRNQRKAFMRYKSSEFLNLIKNEYQTVDVSTVLDDDFFIKREGIIVYKL
jgi:hypothetical protein